MTSDTQAGWCTIEIECVTHVVPCYDDDYAKPVNGHELHALCWCQPINVSGPLDDVVLSHNDASWPGSIPGRAGLQQ